MAQAHLPDFVGKTGQSVVMLVSPLDTEFDDIFSRFHRGEQVAYRFKWNLEQDDNGNYMVVFEIEFDSGEKASIALSPFHWDCLPYLLSYGYLVLMTDPRLLHPAEEGEAEVEKPRAFVIHDAYLGLDGLLRQADQRVQDGETKNLDILIQLFEKGPDDGEKQHH